MPTMPLNIGELPPLGAVPETMLAQVIRPSRFGAPASAFRVERLPVPTLGPKDVLIYVMAAGVNYNNVWAARGVPVNVCENHARYGEPTDFHIGGSDASGVVWAVGEKVRKVKVGDEVVVHCGQWDVEAPSVLAGKDPMFHPSFRIWGYESNYGSFAQFARVQEQQCLPKAPHLTWEAAAAPTLVGATAYRMLHGWAPNTVTKEDVVLVWGGAGGLGSMAIQLAAQAGARVVAVVSSDEKAQFCMRLGAHATIDRRRFQHWGRLPSWRETGLYSTWLNGAKAFGKAIWDGLGEKVSPTLVIEHPGESTLPTSLFVCETGGMVVTCAGTTGYNADLDLRYLWMRQKRVQGSHFANDRQAEAFNAMVVAGKIDPCVSQIFTFDLLGEAHELMADNEHPSGNMAVLVGAPQSGLCTLEQVRALSTQDLAAA